MAFISPMLAAPMPKDLDILPGKMVAEEKWDGIRLIVEIGGAGPRDLFTEGNSVRAWTREGLPQILPRHLTDQLGRLPKCILDGEWYVPGARSYGVRKLTNFDKLEFMAFDILEVMGTDVTDVAYHHRRAMLAEIFQHQSLKDLKMVHLSASREVNTIDEVLAYFHEVRAHDGEGLILKDKNSHYFPGKRFLKTRAIWIKVKQILPARLQIVGYEWGKCGPHSCVKLEDGDGGTATVRVKNTELREAIEKNPDAYIGRWLNILFHERTPDGAYREPRWGSLEE